MPYSTLLVACCCGGTGEGCPSPWRVLKPCEETNQELEFRAPVISLDTFNNLGYDHETVYLYEPLDTAEGECDPYCGSWICIDDLGDDDDDFCRPLEGLEDCPEECLLYTPLLDPPFEQNRPFRILTQNVIEQNELFTPMGQDGCCAEDCPTSCDGLGSDVDCGPLFGCPPCFDLERDLSFGLDFNINMEQPDRYYVDEVEQEEECYPDGDPTNEPFSVFYNCYGFEVTTEMQPSVLYQNYGYASSGSCGSDHLFIGIVVRYDWQVNPFLCNERNFGESACPIEDGGDDNQGCGAWCSTEDDDPDEKPPNYGFFHRYFLFEISGCGAIVSLRKGSSPPGVPGGLEDQALPGWTNFDNVYINSEKLFTSCGFGFNAQTGNGFLPGGPTYSSSNDLETTTQRIGWGGSGVAFRQTYTRKFSDANACIGPSGVSISDGLISHDFQLTITIADLPDPCDP